jgi:hypothetical protein
MKTVIESKELTSTHAEGQDSLASKFLGCCLSVAAPKMEIA